MPELYNLLRTTRKITDFTKEVTCIEWCVNILRGDVLGKATKIISSRYVGYRDLSFNEEIRLNSPRSHCDQGFNEYTFLIRTFTESYVDSVLHCQRCTFVGGYT